LAAFSRAVRPSPLLLLVRPLLVLLPRLLLLLLPLVLMPYPPTPHLSFHFFLGLSHI